MTVRIGYESRFDDRANAPEGVRQRNPDQPDLEPPEHGVKKATVLHRDG